MARRYLINSAQLGFEAYNATGPNPGLAHDGRPVPKWNEIAEDKREQIQGKWMGAADAIAKEIIRVVFAQWRAGHVVDDVEHNARLMFTLEGGEGRPATTFSGNAG